VAEIQVARSDFRRQVAKTPSISVRNRFFEQNPILNADKEFTSLIARPRLKKWIEAGTGHVRGIFSEPGTFSDNVFVISGLNLYRVSQTTQVATLVGQTSTNLYSSPSFAAVQNIGTTPGHLFIADGSVLWCYSESGNATGHLTAAGAVANNDTVTIDTVVYKFTNAGVNVGTPAGTLANPWLVAMGISTATALTNLYRAINGFGTPGTDYSTALVAHATCNAYSVGATDLFVAYNTAGVAGNVIATTETGANISWGAATLANGGAAQIRQVAVPGDVGAISIAHINSYVIVVPVQGQNVNGQFYWINPGETNIDPLDFATAERSPDAINQVIVFSDRFWFPGQKTTEAWVTTGNADSPVQRFSGVLYDRGAWAGTAVKVKDSMILVDEDGGVFQIGGGLKRISRPDIEERIRRAIQIEKVST
jgi:hypothetical protein